MSKKEITITTAGPSVEILEGTASPKFNSLPQNREWTGTINAPKNHLEGIFINANLSEESETITGSYRSFSEGLQNGPNPFSYPHPANMLVRYSKSGEWIIYETNRFSEHGNEKVKGQLTINPDLVSFRINDSKTWGLVELAKFLRMNRAFFTPQQKCDELVKYLRNFKAKIEQDVQQSSDDRGTKQYRFDQKVNNVEIPESFLLGIPIYTGFDSHEFEVEILFEAQNGNVEVWLESPMLRQIQIEIRDKIFEESLQPFRDKSIIIIEENQRGNPLFLNPNSKTWNISDTLFSL